MRHRKDTAVPVTGSPLFCTTLGSVVRTAGRSSGRAAEAAIEQLCQAYWYPLYAFSRRMGSTPPEAQDLTQEFFQHLLQSNLFGRAEPAAGRFRSLLLTSFKNFTGQARIKARAQKRGGGLEFVSIEMQEAEGRYQLEPTDGRSPDRIYDRRWAVTLIERVLQRLESEATMTGRRHQFNTLQRFLVGDKEGGYAEISRDLNLSEGALRVAVHRLRLRFRELFREELAQTVASSADFDEELRHIFTVLAE